MIRRYDEDGLEIDRYDPARDNAAALRLEERVFQGERYALSFRRSAFHRRAENFDDWAIFSGFIDGELVGLVGAARKVVSLLGEPARAKFLFDLRVDPAFRERGIGRRLAAEALAWQEAEDDLAYTWIVDDNRSSAAVSRFLGGACGGGYRYLVYPTHRRHPRRLTIDSVAMAEVHRLHVEHCGPFGLYCDPTLGNTAGHVDSWVIRRGRHAAGCSAWDNREILGEVVERLPVGLAAAGAVLRAWPFRLARLPHVPRRGEAVQSWYLFDCFATEATLARELFRHVAADARDRATDYCYVVHDQRDPWIDAVRSDLPKPFAPILQYSLWARWPGAGPFPELGRVYVDVRDI